MAVLTLAGLGPIPSIFRNWGLLGQVSDAVEALPVATQAQMLVELKRPDDYIAFAERGLFSYDWTDFHRRSVDHVHRYEMQSRPLVPVQIGALDLPQDVRQAVHRLPGITFAKTTSLRVDLNARNRPGLR